MNRLVIILLFASSFLQAQSNYKFLLDSLHPSFSGQILLDSKLRANWQHYQGLANRNWNIAMNDSAVMDLASLNKSFIANLVLQACAEGHWNLDRSLNDILASLDFETRFDAAIDLRSMLAHLSGLPDYDAVPQEWQEDGFRRFKRKHFNNQEYLHFISGLSSEAPYKRFYYSNFAYHILAILLEELYQRPFHDILQEKIADPLKMTGIYAYRDREIPIPNLALAYQMQADQWRENAYIDMSLGRRIFCNAEDLMLWLDQDGGAKLLPDSLAVEVFKNQVAPYDSQFSYGLGWVPYAAKETFKMGDLGITQAYFIHGGSTEGYQSIAISVNKGETKLVILSNSGDGAKIYNLAKSIIHEIYPQ